MGSLRGQVRTRSRQYTLRDSNWNITEAQLKVALNSPSGTVLTAWQWEEGAEDHDRRVQTFEAKVRFMSFLACSRGVAGCLDTDVVDV